MAAALAAGGPVTLAELDTFVDGAAVRRVGEVSFPLVRASGAELVGVAEGRVCTEMLDLYQVDGIIAEPAGRAGRGRARRDGRGSSRGRPWCACSPAATTTSAATPRWWSARWCTAGSSTTSWSSSRRSPGALRRFLDEVLGPDDDIVLFEYVKRDNRETGAALVGIEIATATATSRCGSGWRPARCASSWWRPGSAAYRFLV